eukprot:1158230-Pelagomonas_calceolata.AAC.6
MHGRERPNLSITIAKSHELRDALQLAAARVDAQMQIAPGLFNDVESHQKHQQALVSKCYASAPLVPLFGSATI